jgi:regulator of protease activity HflC (stomatin/prohibitin superfamily)
VSLLDLHPPQDVVPDYYEVAKAMEQRARRINEAQESALAKLKKADADVQALLARARTAKTDKVKRAAGDKERFLARSQARSQLSWSQELLLAMDQTEALLAGTPLEQARKNTDERRRRLALVQSALTDLRLFWDSAAKALAGREMILIDSDKLHGRRQLFLLDPEQLRVPLPMFFPSERDPPPRSPLHREEGP